MNVGLFIITGTSGTGKTTVLPLLKEKLRDNYKAYDWDEILRPYDNTGEVWAKEVAAKMFQIAVENSDKKISTVILGLVRPEWIKEFQDKYGVKDIKFCLLDISVEERTKRLKMRGATEDLINDLEEHEGLPKWIEDSGYSNLTIDTTNLSPEEVAERLVEWVQK